MNERYCRQMALPEIGEAGQQKLSEAKVLIVGVGGLGSPMALYLAGAGVGCIGLIDNDVVSESNLHRQILYTTSEIGLPKAEQAKKHLLQLNNKIKIEAYTERLTADNAQVIISKYDIVADGCDNYSTRYLINDICQKQKKAYIYGAIRAFEGQVSVFNYQDGMSYRDLFPDEKEMLSLPPAEKGVIGVTPGIVGCAEANEVLKVICGYGNVLRNKLWSIDLKTLNSHIIELL